MVQTNPFLSGRAMKRLSESKDGELGELTSSLSLSDTPEDATAAAAGADGAGGYVGDGGENSASGAADEEGGGGGESGAGGVDDASDQGKGGNVHIPPIAVDQSSTAAEATADTSQVPPPSVAMAGAMRRGLGTAPPAPAPPFKK